MYPDGTFHHARQRWLPYFPGKCTSGIAGNGISWYEESSFSTTSA